MAAVVVRHKAVMDYLVVLVVAQTKEAQAAVVIHHPQHHLKVIMAARQTTTLHIILLVVAVGLLLLAQTETRQLAGVTAAQARHPLFRAVALLTQAAVAAEHLAALLAQVALVVVARGQLQLPNLQHLLKQLLEPLTLAVAVAAEARVFQVGHYFQTAAQAAPAS